MKDLRVGALVVLVVIGCVLLALLLARSAPAPRLVLPQPTVPTRPRHVVATDPLASGSQVALGVNVDGPPGSAVAQFSKLVGVRPKLVMEFQTWDTPLLFPQDVRAAASVGAKLIITWDPIRDGQGIPLAQIAAGRYDAYIERAAYQAATYGQRLYIRLAHEMNLGGSAFGPGRDGNTPATFIAAWRHVVSIFRREHALNAEFVWSPNVFCDGHCPFTAFYPGNAWVDWVALDGYNYGPVDGDPYLSFAQIFGPSYAILTRLTNKPLMIGETASTELGGDKAAWIRGMGRELRTQFHRVRALVWFQRIKETDWRVNSSIASLAAFRAVVRSHAFSG